MGNISSINIIPSTDYNPSFSWQVGYNSIITPIDINNLFFRATIRPIHGLENYTRIPSPNVLYEETGILINNSLNQGIWTFSLIKNASIIGGPYRNYQTVIEAHDINGNTSAGNMVGTQNEDGWIAFSQGYDIISVQNPRQSGIELGNNLPTQYTINSNIGNTGFVLNSGNGYYSLNYMGTHGEINIRYLAGNFNSNLVGGYLYVWTGQFPKLETALGISGYNMVSKSQFSFDPTLGYIYHPTAAMSFRGANSVFVSVSFFDELDAIAISSGLNISTGLYISDNAICYNDIAAGSVSIGGFQTLYSMQYTGIIQPTGTLGNAVSILSTQYYNGNTYVLYMSNPNISTTGMGGYTGTSTITPGGVGGVGILLYNNPITNISSSHLLTMLIPYGNPSNSSPTGIASSSAPGAYPWWAFDGQGHQWSIAHAANLPQWLQYQFLNPVNVVYYGFNANQSLYVNPPNTFSLSGSNDGIVWTALDSRSNIKYAGYPYLTGFQIPNSNYYTYYRFYIVSANKAGSSTTDAISVSQLQMSGYTL